MSLEEDISFAGNIEEDLYQGIIQYGVPGFFEQPNFLLYTSEELDFFKITSKEGLVEDLPIIHSLWFDFPLTEEEAILSYYDYKACNLALKSGHLFYTNFY